MNRKHIAQALSRKVDDWISNINNEEIKTIVKNNAIITGGALVSLLTGVEVKDFDVYFRTKEATLAVARYYAEEYLKENPNGKTIQIMDEEDRISAFISSVGLQGTTEEEKEIDGGILDAIGVEAENAKTKDKKKYKPIFWSSNAITLSDKIQVVLRFFGEAEELHKNFDFVHCLCSWTSWDNKITLPAEALESIINKQLVYIGSRYPLCSIFRTRKFIQRGWTINAGQYLKMALQLQPLNLTDIAVLKDQLTGVDSTYFEVLINILKGAREKDPSLQIDNRYIFEIVNRVF